MADHTEKNTDNMNKTLENTVDAALENTPDAIAENLNGENAGDISDAESTVDGMKEELGGNNSGVDATLESMEGIVFGANIDADVVDAADASKDGSEDSNAGEDVDVEATIDAGEENGAYSTADVGEDLDADATADVGEGVGADATVDAGESVDADAALEAGQDSSAEASNHKSGKKRGRTSVKERIELRKEKRKQRLEELDNKIRNLKHTQMEMNDRMRQMLAKDIQQMKAHEKGRSAEIIGVFAKHNFYANGLTPEELRLTLEDLGPTYVKIGQIMSSRVDILPESYCKELEKLRQNVQELDPALARAVIEQETGKKIDEIYREFRDKPLGSASIGQAHYAVLKDGTEVVTKVQRPLIADMMRKDFILLKKLASAFNVVMEGADNAEDQLDLLEVIEEFEKVTDEELDCRVEAENTKFFKENCIEDESKATCPIVYDELTTERIFTMSFVDGYSVSKKDRLIADGYDVEEIGRNIVDSYVHQVLDVGVFHADPHQGNIMVSHGIPCWIDFGMIGRITDADVNIIQNLILAVLESDVETIANTVMQMGEVSSKTNRDRLIEDLDVFMDRYMNVTSLNDLDVSVLFEEVCALGEKHHIKMPGKFTMLVRSLGTIEGVIEQLCPSLNLFEILSNKLMDRAKQNFDLEQKLISTGKDILEIGKKTARIPVLASDLLKSAARGRMKMNLELTGYEDLLVMGGDTVKNIVMAIFACVLFLGSCLLCMADITPKAPGGVPVLAAIGLIFSISLGIHAVDGFSKKK